MSNIKKSRTAERPVTASQAQAIAFHTDDRDEFETAVTAINNSK